MHSLIADGTFPPRLVIKGQVMQHTRPAVDVTAASDLGCQYTTAHCHAQYNRLTSDAVTGLCYSLFTLTTPTRQNCLVFREWTIIGSESDRGRFKWIESDRYRA